MRDDCHIHQPLALLVMYSLVLQGFDKYGVWACGAHPVPNLQKALNLKVLSAIAGPCVTACLPSSSTTFHVCLCIVE